MNTILPRLYRALSLTLGNQPTLSRYFYPLLQRLAPGYLPGHYRAKLVSKVWQTADMLELTLKVSSRWPGFMPGQHIMLTLEHNGRLISRPFSICSAVTDWHSRRHISLCCKVSRKGEFTPLLNPLVNGSRVNISAAQGDFYWQKPATPALFIAAGSGITPIAAMLLSQRHWLAPATLHYRTRGTENAAFLRQLRQLAKQQSQFSLQISDSRLEPATDFCQRLQQSVRQQHIYLCGPATFMQQITAALNSQGVAQGQIFTEQFGIPTTASLAVNDEHTDSTLTYTTTFICAGATHQVAASTQHSLLQSAEQHGLTPSFGCRMGVCFQCVCDKVSGQVRDLRSGTLSGHGAEQIQLCISQPVTELVIKL